MTTIAYLVAGLALLAAGAEMLVRGSSRLAAAVGVSPLVIGLTLVSLGVSSPELAVSLFAAHAGKGDIAIGNVVGSNILNVLLVLGLASIIRPLVVAQPLVRWDVPIMIGVSILMLLLGVDGTITRGDGLLLCGLLIVNMVFRSRQERGASREVREEFAREYPSAPAGSESLKRNLGLVVMGIAGLMLGSRWMVVGAVAAAHDSGVSELVIGLTIVATGTSLPELATALVATRRGEPDIAVGSVVGGNIVHILAVVGLSGLLTRQGIDVSVELLRFDIPIMILAALTCLPIFSAGLVITRWEGFLFLTYYLAYLAYLLLASLQPAILPIYVAGLLGFLMPVSWLAWLTLRNPYFGVSGGR